jgi:hypothetical protein
MEETVSRPSAVSTLLRYASSAIAFVFVSVVIAAAQPAQPKADDKTCGVGVISAIGDTFTATRLGFTIFNNELNRFSVDAWHIDDVVFGKIAAALGKRTNVKRISFPKGSFAVLEEDHGPFYTPDEDVRAILQRITASTKCSQYIAVVKTSLRYKSGKVDGLGIEGQGGQYFLLALFTMVLHNGQNMSQIAKYPPSIGAPNFLGAKKVPMLEVDASYWPESNAQQNVKLRDRMRALVEKGLDGSLSDLPK